MTARLALMPTAFVDAADIVALHRDPRVTQYLIDAIPDEPWKAGVYLRWAAGLHAAGLGPWTARRRRDGCFLGLFTLTPFNDAPPTGLLELGGRLARAGWAGDQAAEAGAALITHAFGPLNRDELVSAHHPDSPTVPPLLARLGFRDPRPTILWGRDAVLPRLSRADWVAQGSRPQTRAPRGRGREPGTVADA